MTELKEYLSERGISVNSLAEECDISRTTLHNYVAGELAITSMPLGMAGKLAEALHITIENLLDMADPVDQVDLSDGWNDLGGMEILIEHGEVIRGVRDNKPVYMYRASRQGGYDKVSAMEVKDFKRRTRKGLMHWF